MKQSEEFIGKVYIFFRPFKAFLHVNRTYPNKILSLFAWLSRLHPQSHLEMSLLLSPIQIQSLLQGACKGKKQEVTFHMHHTAACPKRFPFI